MMTTTTCRLAGLVGGSGVKAAFQTNRHFSSSLKSVMAPGPVAAETTRQMTTTASSFDKETSAIYKQIAENHKHPSGPWSITRDIVHTKAQAKGTSLSVLDLATGPGEPALLIAQDLPEAHVMATDISPDQIDLVNQVIVAESIPNMKAQVVDMQDLHQFEDQSFDIVTCCYGFMFPDNIPLAVSESYRVLKRGGTLVATTWNHVPMMGLVRAIMTDVLGKEPPAPPINPLSLKEPGLFESMLKTAGYQQVEVQVHRYPFDFGSDPMFQYKAVVLPVHEVLDEMNAWDAAHESFVKHKLEFGSMDEHGHYVLAGSEYKLTVATKPH